MTKAKSVAVDMDKVKDLTYKKFWTLAELARQAQVSQATLFSLCAAHRKASFRTVYKISTVLGVDPEEIVK